jgi:uncharacterized membrane protein YphA (DoxX/SURF4 family)
MSLRHSAAAAIGFAAPCRFRLSPLVERTGEPIHWRRPEMISKVAILVARVIFAGAFFIAMFFKFTGIGDTATAIASIGFPFPLFFAWVAAFFELGLALAFLTGAFFTEAAILAAAYVLFLGFAFHGPSAWHGNPMEFGFFVDHFVFIAGLLYAAVHGPASPALRWTLPWLAARPSAPPPPVLR